MTVQAVPEPLLVLPVQQPDADQLALGETRQLSRNFGPDERMVGRWVAIQATSCIGPKERIERVEWAVVAVGKLTGAGRYPGFSRDPAEHMGRSYRRETGQSGAWVWTFSHVKAVGPVKMGRLPEEAVNPRKPGSYHVDDGAGTWWSTCYRELDQATVDRVRLARRKATVK